MDNLKKISDLFQCVLISLPLVLSIIAANKASALYSILALALAIIDVVILPVCKKSENTWMFFIIAITVTPINIRIIIHFVSEIENLFFRIVIGLLVYFIMLSIEELIAGIFTRTIWPKQNEFDDYEFIDSYN